MKPCLKAWSAGALAATILATASTSHAQRTQGFGERGELIIAADRLFPLFGYTHASTTTTNNNTTTTTSESGSSISLLAGLDPQFVGNGNVNVVDPFTLPRASIDYVVVNHVAVGGSVILGFGLGGTNKVETNTANTSTSQSVDAPTTTVFGIAPRGGYILGLTDLLGLWLRGGFSFYSIHVHSVDQNNNPNNQNSTTFSSNLFAIDLDPQLVIVPVEHFFLQIGPVVDIPLTGSQSIERVTGATTQTTSSDLSIFHIGFSGGVGGWFNL